MKLRKIILPIVSFTAFSAGYLFANNNDYSFNKFGEIVNYNSKEASYMIPADFDGDGDIDLAVIVNDGFSSKIEIRENKIKQKSK